MQLGLSVGNFMLHFMRVLYQYKTDKELNNVWKRNVEIRLSFNIGQDTMKEFYISPNFVFQTNLFFFQRSLTGIYSRNVTDPQYDSLMF